MAVPFRLQVITPEREFLDDAYEMVVFDTPDGEIGLMAGHAPMVSSLSIGPVRLLKDGAWKAFAASDGFVIVDQSRVTFMVQTAEWPEEIDINRAKAQQDEAMEKLRQQRSMQEYHAARSMLTRAMVRLRVSGRSTGES